MEMEDQEQNEVDKNMDDKGDFLVLDEARSFVRTGPHKSEPCFKGMKFLCFGNWEESGWNKQECERQLKENGAAVVQLVDFEDVEDYVNLDGIILGRGTSLEDLRSSSTMVKLFEQVRVAFLDKLKRF